MVVRFRGRRLIIPDVLAALAGDKAATVRRTLRRIVVDCAVLDRVLLGLSGKPSTTFAFESQEAAMSMGLQRDELVKAFAAVWHRSRDSGGRDASDGPALAEICVRCRCFRHPCPYLSKS